MTNSTIIMTPEPEDGRSNPEKRNEGNEVHQQPVNQLIRQGKTIVFDRPPNPKLDETVVSVERYNCFGTSLYPNRTESTQIVAGVTSPNRGEGKSLVAANLATFFALDTQEETVLVDLNFSNPSVHKIFGVRETPGIRDAFVKNEIRIAKTSIRGLWVLPAGEGKEHAMSFEGVIGLREVVSALKEKFRFIIVDLPSVHDPAFSNVVGSYVDGYIVVVSAGETKKDDVSRLVTLINENKIIGFVLNRASKGMARL